MPHRPRLLAARRFVWRWRAPLAATLVALAALTAASALMPQDPDRVDLAVASRDLPPGHVLAASDLDVIRADAAAKPPDAMTGPGAVGEILAHPLPKGVALTRGMLRGVDAWPVAQEGDRVVATRLADPAVTQLLSAGQRVELIRVGDMGGPAVVIGPATVLGLVTAGSSSALWGTAQSTDTSLVVFSADASLATLMLEAGAAGALTVVLN